MPKISDSHKKKIESRVANRRKIRKFKAPVFPDMIVLEYSRAINKEVKKIDDLVKDILIPHLDKITNTKNERLDSSIRLDIELKKLFGVALVAELIRRVKSKFYGESLEEDQEPSQRLFVKSIRRSSNNFLNRANDFSEKRFVSEFENQTGTKPLDRHLNVNEFIVDATRKNISLIKTIPGQYFDKIQTLVEHAVDRGQLTRDVKSEISNISKEAKNRSKLIARDQVGKLVGVTNEARQKNLGVSEYIWRIIGDSRVRSFSNTKGVSDHQRLDGTLHKWSNPPQVVFKGKRSGERLHPTQDFQCRCHAQPVYDKITGITNPETEKARQKSIALGLI